MLNLPQAQHTLIGDSMVVAANNSLSLRADADGTDSSSAYMLLTGDGNAITACGSKCPGGGMICGVVYICDSYHQLLAT